MPGVCISQGAYSEDILPFFDNYNTAKAAYNS